MESVTSETMPVRAGRVIQRLGLGLSSRSPDLLDWREVAGVAIDVVGEKWSEAAVPDGVAAEFTACVDKVVPAVADFTGLDPVIPLCRPVVFNRSEWIVTTAQTLKPLREPFLEQIVGRRSQGGGRFMKAALWGELGVVLGYLARRVLGQYDISMLDPNSEDGRLFFIYPNIVDTEKRLDVDGAEFRLWLALHEVTHAFEFQSFPWLRHYISELMLSQLAYLRDHLEDGKSTEDGDSVITGPAASLLMPPAWRELMSVEENVVLAKTQALMSVLEGYSEYVMERAGSAVGAEQNIAEMFEHARRTKPLINKLFERLIGLQVKMDQYRMGYRFIAHAARFGDMELVNRVWDGPEKLPTLTELDRPELWVTRMLK